MMKSLTATAVVALTAGLIGLGGMVPAVIAQQQQPAPPAGQQMQPGNTMPGQMQPRPHRPGFGGFNLRRGGNGMGMQANRGPRGGGSMLQLVCSDRAAERLEIAFVRLSHRITLTPQQQPLFDDLRTTALTAQTQFADSCTKAAQPAAGTATATPDPLAGMKARLELDKARIAATETVLPKFEAFFTSLTDEQKASLAPRGNGRNNGQGFGRHRGPGMGMNRPQSPAPGMTAPAPTTPPAGAPAAPAPTQG